MRRNWFCVTSPLNWLVARKEQVWGVDYRYEKTIKQRVNEGDMRAFYILKSIRRALKSRARMEVAGNNHGQKDNEGSPVEPSSRPELPCKRQESVVRRSWKNRP